MNVPLVIISIRDSIECRHLRGTERKPILSKPNGEKLIYNLNILPKVKQNSI